MADPDGRACAPGERCEDKMARRARIRARRAKEMEVAARAEAQFTETTVTVTTAYKQETRVRGATAAETNLGTPENFKQPEGASAAPKEREQQQKTSRLKEKKGGRRNVKRHIREKRRSTGIVNLQLSLADDLDDEHDQNPKPKEAVTTSATHQNDRKY